MSTKRTGLPGHTAFVSHSTRGPGRAVADFWGQAGAKVALHYRQNRTGAEESAKRFKSDGGKGLLVRADLADEGQLEMLTESLRRELGGLDLLCLNLAMKAETAATAEWSEALALSLKHLLTLSKAGKPPQLFLLVPDETEGAWAATVVSQTGEILVKNGAAATFLPVRRGPDNGWAPETLAALADLL